MAGAQTSFQDREYTVFYRMRVKKY